MPDYFPCPVCGAPLDVRESKKAKPYITCDPCGIQVFVRGAAGIEKFRAAVKQAKSGNALDRYAEMERLYRKTCPKCGKTFWITPEITQTSWFEGTLTGYRCPRKGCNGVVKLEDE